MPGNPAAANLDQKSRLSSSLSGEQFSTTFHALKDARLARIEQIGSMRQQPRRVTDALRNGSQEEALFDNLIEAKQLTSQLSMHLTPRWREMLFAQLDRLLSFDNWDHDSSLLALPSLRTFLRFVIYGAVSRMPALGISDSGCLLASWRSPSARASVRFMPDDKAELVRVHENSDGTEPLVFIGAIEKLVVHLTHGDLVGSAGLNEHAASG